MADLLLLGKVPGTSIVITFWSWLAIVFVVFSVYLLVNALRGDRLPNKLVRLLTIRSRRAYLNYLDQIAL